MLWWLRIKVLHVITIFFRIDVIYDNDILYNYIIDTLHINDMQMFVYWHVRYEYIQDVYIWCLKETCFLLCLEAYCVIPMRLPFLESIDLPGSRRPAETYDLMDGEAKARIRMALHGRGYTSQ